MASSIAAHASTSFQLAVSPARLDQLSSSNSIAPAVQFVTARRLSSAGASTSGQSHLAVTAIFNTGKKVASKAVGTAKSAAKGANKLAKGGNVESGVFGTSGGTGFTKENEVFVGRVAMLGFAASLVGELVTGEGILHQLGYETGIPLNEIDPLIGFFLLFNVFIAIGALGDRGRFIDEAKPALTKAVIPPGKGFRAALGLNEKGPVFGFTKANELFVGRMAQLGFVASLLGELLTGKGALAQLNVETGIPLSEIDPLVGFFIVALGVAAISPASGKFVTDEDLE